MGLIRLKVRELADEKGWTLKEVSNRTGIPYTTIAIDDRAVCCGYDRRDPAFNPQQIM